MKNVRIGIVGLGMGSVHARNILDGKIARCELAALCDTAPERLAQFPGIRGFSQAAEMIRSGAIDAILIATPHFAHVPIGIDALSQGLHVLVEKPVAVHKADAERLLAAHRRKDQVFAAMFNQRADPRYIRLRDMIQRGELGQLRRICWTITSWFRTEAYYASGGWRATWAGEGGGVLLNQCPHNLDLFQWLFGMPSKVRAFCSMGRYHDIEVEDDVTAYLEYASGANALFVTSTGEAPGTDRLEVCAERGRVVLESGRLEFIRNEMPMTEYSRTTAEKFVPPKSTREEIAFGDVGPQHAGILQNFVDAILDGAPLIAPAAEGILSVELANSMVYSSETRQTIALPLDAAAYRKFLEHKIATSTHVKKVAQDASAPMDFSKSWRKTT